VPVDPKFQVEEVAPTNHSSSHKTGLSCGTRMQAQFSFVLSQITRTDRRTDRILIARPRLHAMQRGKNLRRNKSRLFAEYETVMAYSLNSHVNKTLLQISAQDQDIDFVPIKAGKIKN